jgi:hypothetical protein
MVDNRKVWLFDEQGNKVKFEELPDGLKQLRDDPYRSLAWAVEKQGGFYKPCSDFGEFEWAKFFRTHGGKGDGAPIATPDEIRANLKKVAKLATKLAQSDAAKELPGYKGNPKPPQCPAVSAACGDE